MEPRAEIRRSALFPPADGIHGHLRRAEQCSYPATVTIQAALSSNSAINGTMTATITSAGLSVNVADRFLEQTTFGPTNPLIAQVQQTGLQNFLTAQLAMTVTPYADPAATETNNTLLQQRYFVQLISAPDQLRQRVAFALAQIFVIAGDKINTPQAYTPYLDLLENDAFTNYRQIMQDVTLSPAMGHYLDMVNNDKPNVTTGTHADENYAREAMQLFTIGLSMLNEDGSLQLSNGSPIPTYTQDTVVAFARAYTGWTYPTQPGATLQKHNPAYWTGPMVAFESNHDSDPKQLLRYTGAASGGLLPGGQSAEQDLAGALDNIFNHPNVPPFVALRLIQHLVTSNPSPAYIQRVADVFKNNGSGVRGDMAAVITAVLMDPEARRGDNPATAVGTDGHLQEPILYMTGLLREFNASYGRGEHGRARREHGTDRFVSGERVQFLLALLQDVDRPSGAGISASHDSHRAQPRELGKFVRFWISRRNDDHRFFDVGHTSGEPEFPARFSEYADAARHDVDGHA